MDGNSATCNTPAHAAGAVNVVVTTNGGQASLTGAFTYETPLPPAPDATSISPTSGSTSGGTTVTISGSNLAGATVKLDGSDCTSVNVAGDGNSLTCVTPSHGAGVAAFRWLLGQRFRTVEAA